MINKVSHSCSPIKYIKAVYRSKIAQKNLNIDKYVKNNSDIGILDNGALSTIANYAKKQKIKVEISEGSYKQDGVGDFIHLTCEKIKRYGKFGKNKITLKNGINTSLKDDIQVPVLRQIYKLIQDRSEALNKIEVTRSKDTVSIKCH